MTATTTTDFYPDALHVDEIFADPTYQRVLDVARARKMAATWDRRLAGILEVSDRGEGHTPRYAVMDGQHRWAAAGFLADRRPLVANVHTGLTVADEAKLFDQLNRQRRQTSTWDHWKARRASGDKRVMAIETVVTKHGLTIDIGPVDGFISCTSTLEKIEKLGGTALLDDALTLITGAWQTRRDGLDAPIIHGVAMVLHHLSGDLDLERLANTLIDVMPRHLKTQAAALREMSPGNLSTVTAIVIMGMYNKKPGRKIDVTHKTFGGTGVHNAARDRVNRRGGPATRDRQHAETPNLEQIGDPGNAPKRTVPDALPHYADTEEHTEAVAAMEGKPVAEIAQALGIPERTVRRIQVDLGIGVAS